MQSNTLKPQLKSIQLILKCYTVSECINSVDNSDV